MFSCSRSSTSSTVSLIISSTSSFENCFSFFSFASFLSFLKAPISFVNQKPKPRNSNPMPIAKSAIPMIVMMIKTLYDFAKRAMKRSVKSPCGKKLMSQLSFLKGNEATVISTPTIVSVECFDSITTKRRKRSTIEARMI